MGSFTKWERNVDKKISRLIPWSEYIDMRTERKREKNNFMPPWHLTLFNEIWIDTNGKHTHSSMLMLLRRVPSSFFSLLLHTHLHFFDPLSHSHIVSHKVRKGEKNIKIPSVDYDDVERERERRKKRKQKIVNGERTRRRRKFVLNLFMGVVEYLFVNVVKE